METSANLDHSIYFTNTQTFTTVTQSIYVKPNGRNNVSLRFYFGASDWVATVFDLTGNGAITQSSAGASSMFTAVSRTIVNVGNDWYRISMTATQPSRTSFAFALDLCSSPTPTLSATGGVESYVGDITKGLFIWGAQLNTGSVALSYTQTTTTAQTLADAVQATAASQPLLLAHNGADNYFFSTNVSGNRCSTPNSAAVNITGDIECIGKINTIGNTSEVMLAWLQNSYTFYVTNTGIIGCYLKIGAGALTFYNSTTIIPITGIVYVKITRQASSGDIKFYYSSDGITYTQLGTTVTSTAGALASSALALTVQNGDWFGGARIGYVYRMTLANSIGGTPVVDFNPSTYNAATNQTAWTSTTSETWTVNTSVTTTGYKAVLVDRTMIQTDGVDDFMTSSTITSISNRTNYLAVITWVSTNGSYFMDGNLIATNGVLTGNTDKIGILANSSSTVTTATYTQQRKLSTTKLSGTIQGAAINNGTEVTATIVSPLSFTSVVLGRAGNGVATINAVLSTIVISNSADNTTNRTAMYNLIRSLNNNAF
jgi:hypothetical protein